jgi:hypothetical protein
VVFLNSEALSGDSGRKLHIDDFGVAEGKPITNGFVFIDGRYIDAPYRVDRKGLGIFINDVLIEPPIPWSGEPKLSGETDPAMPEGITKDTSINDPNLSRYLGEKIAYLNRHYSQVEAVRMMKQVYNDLPCVKEIQDVEHEPLEITVTTYRGETSARIHLTPFPRKVDMSKKGVLGRLDQRREHFESRLQKGDYFFFSARSGGLITGGARAAAEVLPRIVLTLRSAKDEATKFKEVQQAGLPDVRKDSFAAIVTNFAASPQLEQRLQVPK